MLLAFLLVGWLVGFDFGYNFISHFITQILSCRCFFSFAHLINSRAYAANDVDGEYHCTVSLYVVVYLYRRYIEYSQQIMMSIVIQVQLRNAKLDRRIGMDTLCDFYFHRFSISVKDIFYISYNIIS